MNIRRIGLCLLFGVVFIQGCSSIGKTYLEINPEAAEEEIKKANGYYVLQEFKNKDDKTRPLIVFRAPQFYGASYYQCEAETCLANQYTYLGRVQDFSDGYILPWIAKGLRVLSLASKKTFLDKQVDPGVPLKIKAQGGSWDMNTNTSRSCGPVYAGFIPEAGHAYVVHYKVEGGQCYISIYDATDPDQLVKLQ